MVDAFSSHEPVPTSLENALHFGNSLPMILPRTRASALTASALLVLATSPALAAGEADAVPKGAAVTVLKAAKFCFGNIVEVSGIVLPRDEQQIRPDRFGLKVAEVMADPGDTVTAGQVLAKLTDGTNSVNVTAPVAGTISASSAIIGSPASGKDALFSIIAKSEYDLVGMTTTFQIVRELGWPYLEKLAKQRVMQVQSSTDPPKKLSLGERAVMADGNEYGIVLLKEAGQPVEPVYPTEGTPTISGPTGIFAAAPHPNAARLFQAWLHTRETQQFFVDFTGQYSLHAQVQPKAGRRKLSDIKLMKEDPAGVEAMTEEIKTRYARLFKV